MLNTQWKSKNIVITGGSSGLGRALAIQFHALGARVAVIARRQLPLQQLVDAYPGIIGIAADVSRKAGIYPLAGELHARLGDVDLLMNVASALGSTPLRLLIDTDCEDFEDVLQTNLLGPFRLTKALLPAMLLREQGVVVNISSDAAVNAYPKWGAYGVSKAAVDHLSHIFHAELSAAGLRFLSLDPGDMRTPMHFAAVPGADPDQLRDPMDSAQRIIEVLNQDPNSDVRRSV